MCSFEIEKAGTKENSKKAPLWKPGWSFCILSDLAIKPNPRKELKIGPYCIYVLETGQELCTKLCPNLARLIVENKITNQVDVDEVIDMRNSHQVVLKCVPKFADM